jgi:hypothetical protein
MTVRTYYGTERVTVAGPNGSRLVGTVSGTAGGRVVVALDEPTPFYPVGYVDKSEEYPDGIVPGIHAEVLERDLEFFTDDSDSSAPSFSPEQLAYLRRTYGDAIVGVADEEERQGYAETKAFENEGDEDDDAAAAAEIAAAAAKAKGAGLSKAKLAQARNAAETV